MQVVRGNRPPYPVEGETLGLTGGVWSIVEECWAADPSERPHASQVVSRLMAEWS